MGSLLMTLFLTKQNIARQPSCPFPFGVGQRGPGLDTVADLSRCVWHGGGCVSVGSLRPYATD